MVTYSYVLLLFAYCCGPGAQVISVTNNLTEKNCFSRGLTHVQTQTALNGGFMCFKRKPAG